jgi:hypothetical protein
VTAKATGPEFELVAGVIVQRPLAGGQAGVMPAPANLPRVITPGGGYPRKL